MTLSNDQLRAAIARQQWTAQNIRLSPEVETLPGKHDFLAGNMILEGILRTLRLTFGKDFHGLRIADLGCLEGGYALALARLGADAVGVEVREENMEKCRLLQQHFGLPNLRYVKDDVKNFTPAKYGEFDAILALGILYHLDKPVEWLHQIGQATKRVLIIETHFAPERDEDLKDLRPDIQKLGDLEPLKIGDQTFEGRWFKEYKTNAERDGMLWASYSNPDSFWLTRRSLMLAIRRAGFPLLYEQYDHWIDFYELFTKQYPRSLFVGVKG